MIKCRGLAASSKIIYLFIPNVRAWLLDHLTPSLLVPTDDVIIRVFNDCSTLEQVVVIQSGMAAEWAGVVSNHDKLVEVYSQKVISGSLAKAGNSLGSLQVPRNWAHSGQSQI
ncbi:uncharacterized protein TNCV_1120091 [Trichonephila clavipes]|uniref:Uncharacterized protein n=1 Tax=Trichonephila clavipes TaxID=2585209 RepID=A0A8X6T0J0_TRICX|nr:uncharacterized protein TNCV_1120091 [Trichonephila clavipes]